MWDKGCRKCFDVPIDRIHPPDLVVFQGETLMQEEIGGEGLRK